MRVTVWRPSPDPWRPAWRAAVPDTQPYVLAKFYSRYRTSWAHSSNMPSTGIVIMEAFLKPEARAEASISGYVIGRGGAHSIAIHERNGVSWVAEFRDGRGELMNANTWFYFHAERLGYWNRRQAYKSAQPLPPSMLEAIERLHGEREAREAATVTGRCRITLTEAAARLHRALETVAQ